LAYLEQARDFYTGAISAAIPAARPLLLYYCFMNLAKAFILHRGIQATMDQAQHGLSERLRPARVELDDAFLEAARSPSTRTRRLQVFDEFLKAVTGSGLPADTQFGLPHLLPQVVPGHRLWAQAADEEERFISTFDIVVMHNANSETLWLNIYLFEDDMTRLGVTHKRLLQESGLVTDFHQVNCSAKIGSRELICFQQTNTTRYTHRPSDEVLNLVTATRHRLWVTVASVRPYRRYYLYLAPAAESAAVLPQLLSIYAITFYLGSITRYRPHHFDRIIDGPFGPRIEEFISGQPLQFIYLMASEFAQQEITKPSIV
jgi:hypothetical protein